MIADYPVQSVIPDVCQALLHQGIALLQASPGAGKSTILPLHLMNESWLNGRKIIMMQPRRLAARSVAQRLAEQLQEDPGGQVGYRIRLDTCVSSRTRIEVVTEGILSRMMQSDPALEEAGLLIFDEFHERNIHADVALALALQVRQLLRPDLRILIMSATLPAETLIKSLNNIQVIRTSDRLFPVEIIYDEQQNNEPVWERAAVAVRKALREHEGDILVFLPGAREIVRTRQMLEQGATPALVVPLHGELPVSHQQSAILPDRLGRRKVVLATNIAETSLTIEGIRVVIDSGWMRKAVYDPRSGLTRLVTQRITLDSAGQRAGRAGRTAPGVCYRLWTKATHDQLKPERKPEIEEADLSAVVLMALNWGVKDIYELPWITPPPQAAVSQAYDLLEVLGAVQNRKITERGKKMASLPAHPRIAHLLTMNFLSDNQAALAADISALLEERDILRESSETDLTLRVEMLRRFRAGKSGIVDYSLIQRIVRLSAQWRAFLGVDEDNGPINSNEVGYLLLQAYPDRVACQIKPGSSRYRLRTGRVVYVEDSDALSVHRWIVAAHADAGAQEGKIFLAAPINDFDLVEIAHELDTVYWDEVRQMIVGLREQRIGSLVLNAVPLHDIPLAQRLQVLCSEIRNRGLQWLGWDDEHDQWCNRVMSLRRWRPEEAWPDVSMETLIKQLECWLAPFLTDIYRREDFKRISIADALQTLIPLHLQQSLNRLAPQRLEVPSGSRIAIRYKSDGSEPHMEVRLQECFGLMQTPTVNNGHTPVVMHLLSPGYKPVQVTQDLPSFWRNTYPIVRKELMRRYPKHAWPENPEKAQAVRGVLRMK